MRIGLIAAPLLQAEFDQCTCLALTQRGPGGNLTTGSNNIDIGAPGVAGDAGKIRIGKSSTATGTFSVWRQRVPARLRFSFL